MAEEIKVKIKKNTKNYLDQDGIIHSIYWGDQTALTISEAGIEINKLVNELKSKENPILILSDISKIGRINLGARKAGLQLFCDLAYEKLAIIGVTFLTQQLVKAVITASGRGFKIKTFDQEYEAKKWLLSRAS